ncbi:UV radiation resistance protein and autophagy-related subunit 14-domain-containing protein [Collybia nuda]|uniref:Autophagy-related protein 14 n=1 Tax=Collybia nuda TaxID=64659 RepID=A0A9P5XRN2_9AGAR|nr:UV radiation resistance protein and autophagy-related subunit 14-domain-containing protein [Collybia nuda]
MDCNNCELKQRQFFCENCLRTHLRDFRHQTQHFASDRDDQVSKASKALETMEPARIRRATLVEWQNRVDEVMGGLAKLRKENDKKRDRLRTLRENLAARRRTLSAAKLLPQPTTHLASRETHELNTLSVTLARARSGLVQELVEVFNVVEVGGRPPIGGKAGTKGEWTIGDLILPVPGDIRRYPPDHINAVITHTVHFLSLLTFYLGIKLPFEISWAGNKLGVGQPSIGAIKGSEAGGWAKWYTKHPLHLSSATPSASTSTSSNSQTQSLSAIPVSESYTEAADPSPQASFTTALAMLLYNVCYLAYTQSVEVPLSQAGDVLSNLWSVCCSSELGRKSHETAPALPPPTPLSFPLDFTQLLQATTANPASRTRPSRSSKARRSSRNARDKREPTIDEEDGWDLVDGDNFGDGFP